MTDPESLHRYPTEEGRWSPHVKMVVRRLREENAALRDQLAEGGPRPIRYPPDFTPIDGAHVFIQWKGTVVCLDFTCECGAGGHLDGDFVYALRCGACGREWAMPHSLAVVPMPADGDWCSPKDVGMDEE